jgi:hypothetical protein
LIRANLDAPVPWPPAIVSAAAIYQTDEKRSPHRSVQPACASAGNTSSTKKAIVAIRNIVTPYVQDDPNPCFRLLLPCVLETAFAAANDDVTRLGQFTDATDHSHSLVLGVEL